MNDLEEEAFNILIGKTRLKEYFYKNIPEFLKVNISNEFTMKELKYIYSNLAFSINDQYKEGYFNELWGFSYDDIIKLFNQVKNVLHKVSNLNLTESEFKQFKEIDILDSTQLPLLANIKNLESLYITDIEILDLNFLTKLTKLKELYLGYNIIKDLSGLKNLKNLKYLNLGMNKISNISFLSELINLKEL